MEISQITLLRLTVYSFFFGVAVGLLYDACRILRVMAGARCSFRGYPRICALRLPISKRELGRGGERRLLQSVMINIGDFLCVLTAALGAILLSYGYNSGRVRFFCLAAIALGLLLYRVSLGKALIFLLEPVALILKYLFLSILEPIALIARKLYELMRKNVKKVSSLYIFTLEKRNKKLYNIREEVFLSESERQAPCDSGKKLRWKYKTGGKSGGEK